MNIFSGDAKAKKPNRSSDSNTDGADGFCSTKFKLFKSVIKPLIEHSWTQIMEWTIEDVQPI